MAFIIGGVWNRHDRSLSSMITLGHSVARLPPYWFWLRASGVHVSPVLQPQAVGDPGG